MRELIADLPYDDRPRERLFLRGAATLSNSELVSLLLGSGAPGKSAVQVARDITGEGLRALVKRDARQLAEVYGIGAAKAARVVAAVELANRLNAVEVEPPEEPVVEVESFGVSLVKRFARARQERVSALFLDSRFRKIREQEIYVGTVDHAAVSAREVIGYALDANALKVILFHNHPSGDPTPSMHDVEFTARLKEWMRSISVELLDHLIVGKYGFLSMKARGLC